MTSLVAVLVFAAKKGGATGQQKLALALLVAFLLSWLGYVLYAVFLRKDPAEPIGSEVELAPNRKPYFDDDVLETRRLDRALLFALGMLFIIAVGLPLYWLNEPSRQTGAARGFDNAAANAGASLFASATAPTDGAHPIHFGCADCHGGMKAVGQAEPKPFLLVDPAHPDLPPKMVTWQGPPLNTVLLRFSYDKTFTRTEGVPLDAVRTIIVYGRAGTPMPAWGLAGGGPMNDQQIDDLVAYIASIQLTPAQAAADWAARAQATAKAEHHVDAQGNPIVDGQILFDTNCARCHTKGYSYGMPQVPGGGGQFAPNITGGAEVRQFPSIQDQIAFITTGADFGKGFCNTCGGIGQVAGGGMPHFGNYLSQDEIMQIVNYERGL